MNRCPICAVTVVDGPILDHLLAQHPGVSASVGLGLTLASVALRRRPRDLAALHLIVLSGAYAIWLLSRVSRYR